MNQIKFSEITNVDTAISQMLHLSKEHYKKVLYDYSPPHWTKESEMLSDINNGYDPDKDFCFSVTDGELQTTIATVKTEQTTIKEAFAFALFVASSALLLILYAWVMLGE